MTKKLEDLLNLPDSKDIIETAKSQEADQKSYEIEESFRDIEDLDKIQLDKKKPYDVNYNYK